MECHDCSKNTMQLFEDSDMFQCNICKGHMTSSRIFSTYIIQCFDGCDNYMIKKEGKCIRKTLKELSKEEIMIEYNHRFYTMLNHKASMTIEKQRYKQDMNSHYDVCEKEINKLKEEVKELKLKLKKAEELLDARFQKIHVQLKSKRCSNDLDFWHNR